MVCKGVNREKKRVNERVGVKTEKVYDAEESKDTVNEGPKEYVSTSWHSGQ